jgi:phosphoglycerate dehydrogenase-like enzyme
VPLRVLNMLGDGAAAAAREVVPDAEVAPVPHEAIPDDLQGEVLFAEWSLGHPVFDRLDDLGVRWMHLPGTGVDAWPRALLEGRTVTCARGVSAIPIAEFVLGSILAFEKRFPDTWLHAPPEHWNFADLGELAGKTVGLVGLGGIGTAVARRALAFDARVQAIRRRPDQPPVAGVEIVADLPERHGSADHLVLAAPATPATTGLLDTAAFHRVRPGVHVVNMARGSLVDQDALRAALDDGRVARASLDTVDPEPLPAGHWMYSHPKVFLSAHVSWASPRAFDRILAAFADNLRRYAAGEPLEGVVDPEEGY